MYDFVSRELEAFSLPPRRLRKENYGRASLDPAGSGNDSIAGQAPNEHWTITVLDSSPACSDGTGRMLPADPGETVLTVLERAGLNPPALCRSASTVTMDTVKKVIAEHDELDVTYVDARFLTAAYSVIVQDTALAIREGKSFEEVMALLDLMRDNARHLGVVYDLFYLHRTGRIGLAKAALGTAMKIIALLSSGEEPGTLKSIGKAKNYGQCNQRFMKIIREDLEEKKGKSLHAVISMIGPHEKETEDLKRQVESLDVDTRVEIHYTNHSNMAHIGPDFYDIGYVIYG
jgi:DegV family protein with EDD domain